MKKSKSKHQKYRKFAVLLDSWFTIPGTTIKVGLDPIIGLVTGLGDLAGASLSVYFMFYATKLGANTSVLLRMFMNIMADLIIGMIPVLGDLFDVAWKANLRNAKLLDKLEAEPEKLGNESTVLIWLLFTALVLILIGIVIAIVWAIAEVVGFIF
ncbi:MAG: DUF4112 domain-containing protein [Balneolaceae bacterium]